MSENCNSSCSTCSVECNDRTAAHNEFAAKMNEVSNVKKVIGVVSGKGRTDSKGNKKIRRGYGCYR